MTLRPSTRAIALALATSTMLLTPAFAEEGSEPGFKLPAAPSYEGDGWSIELSGRLNYDYTSADADVAPGFDVDDTELRRLGLGVSGTLGSQLKYKVEVQTDESDEVYFEDAYVEFAPTGSKMKFKVGQQRTPNSLDEQTSSRFTSTLERAAFTDAFQFNRRVGVTASTSGKAYTLTAGLFGGNLEGGNAGTGFVAAARGTYTPVMTDETIVHLGASVRYRELDEDEEGLARYRQRPFTHLPGRIISTGRVGDSDMFYGVEAAMIQGPLWVSAEYGITQADATTGSDPDFNGGYIEAGGFIGGHKVYKGGKFDRPVVDRPVTEGGLGALSGVVRYDQVDLRDGSFDGGKLDTFIVGVDWWPTKHSRLGVNYFNADASLGTSTSGLDSNFAALVTLGETDETVDGFVARLQFDF